MDYCYGLALGVFLGNLTSPFGILDWLLMPFITLAGSITGYMLRKYWYLGLASWALITSIGVSLFPLGIGGQLPFLTTFPLIFISQIVIGYCGYLIFIPFSNILSNEGKE